MSLYSTGLCIACVEYSHRLTVERNNALTNPVASIRYWLGQVGLRDFADRYPHELSGGMRQRVAIARALIHEPRLIICDEPTSALDKDTGQRVMELLSSVARGPGRCVIVVTHDNRIFNFADRMTEMDDGRVQRVHENPSRSMAGH